ncbi:MAG: C10 family peptidase [Muribaculaceae bacterium]|nr:C10 family peptidase [Muribaculaceae bacterium]
MKQIFYSLMALLTVGMMQAAPVSPERAQAIAQGHLSTHAARLAPRGHATTPKLVLAAKADNQPTADYYVFNNGDTDGYVIVAGDDRATSVLAYSDEGTFDPANMPAGMRAMLETYAQEVRFLRDTPTAAAATARAPRGHVVKPLLTANWNQNAPFNNLCPTYIDKSGNTQIAATGCVATAAAQIMYYYKYPAHGTGSISYECNVNGTSKQTLSADLGSTTYQWNDMLPHYNSAYNEAQGAAVATLLYQVGLAARMSYASTSTAYPYYMMQGLRKYFGYNRNMHYYRRTSMGITEWENLIYQELDNKRPVIYGGFTNNGGHSFVIDGSDANGYFHINWGWGATSNGYFLITALDPENQGIGSYEGGYNTAQDMVVGIYPDPEGPGPEPEKKVEVFVENFFPSEGEVQLGQPVPMLIERLALVGNGYFDGSDEPKMTLYGKFYLTDKNGKGVEEGASSNVFYQSLLIGASYNYKRTKLSQDPLTYTPSASLPDGEYKLWFLYAVPEAGINTYQEFNHGNYSPGYIDAEVEKGVMYFSMPTTKYKLSVTKLDYPAKVGTQSKVKVTATIHNSGEDYFDYVKYIIVKDNEAAVVEYGQRIGVSSDADVITQGVITAPQEPGEYELFVCDYNDKIISEAYPLTVVESGDFYLNVTSGLKPTNYYMPSGHVTASSVVTNTGTGDYVGTLPYMIMLESTKKILDTGDTDMLTIPAGSSVTINIVSAFEGVPGVVYEMCMRQPTDPTKYYFWGDRYTFEISDDLTGIGNVKNDAFDVKTAGGVLTVSGASRVAVYNMAGALVGTAHEQQLPAGVYIVVADGVAHKVMMR